MIGNQNGDRSSLRETDVLRRRVCIFCETWGSGGIESFVATTLTHMDLSRLKIDIVSVRIQKSPFTERLEALGVCFRELAGERRCVLKNTRLFTKLLREQQYDVMHLNAFHGAMLYYLYLAEREGVPVRIAHSHNTELRRGRWRFAKELIHVCAKRCFCGAATSLWACSDMAARFLFPKKAMLTKSYTFIPNGIDCGGFRFNDSARAAERARLGAEDRYVIGCVGRLCYQKNQDFLLEVFAEFLRSCPESRLLLIGEGDDRAELTDKAERLGISEQTIFYGIAESVGSLFSAMDAFVFPTRFEGLGIVLVEAQAAGLPILCSDRVPEEVRLLPLVRCMPLEASAREWAGELELLRQTAPENRGGYADAVSQKGFDVTVTAKLLEAAYLNRGETVKT